MIPDIYDPLSEYANVYKDKFKEVAEKTFAKLAKEANVDYNAKMNELIQTVLERI